MFKINPTNAKIYFFILLLGFIKLILIVYFADAALLKNSRFQLTHRQLFLALVLAPIIETALVQMLLDFIYKRKIIKEKNILFFMSAAIFGGIHFDPTALSHVTIVSTVVVSFFTGLLLQVLYTSAREANAMPFLKTFLGHFSINFFVALGIYIKLSINAQ